MAKPTTSYTSTTKNTTSYGATSKSSTSFASESKNTTNFGKGSPEISGYLLKQDGGYLLKQDGGKLIISSSISDRKRSTSFGSIGKPVTSYGAV